MKALQSALDKAKSVVSVSSSRALSKMVSMAEAELGLWLGPDSYYFAWDKEEFSDRVLEYVVSKPKEDDGQEQEEGSPAHAGRGGKLY